jgi:hypothetical protein
MLLAYHPDEKKIIQLFKQKRWNYLKIKVGESGLKKKVKGV